MPHLPLTAQSEAAASEEPGAIGGFDTFGAQRLKASSFHRVPGCTGMYRDVPGCTGMYRAPVNSTAFSK